MTQPLYMDTLSYVYGRNNDSVLNEEIHEIAVSSNANYGGEVRMTVYLDLHDIIHVTADHRAHNDDDGNHSFEVTTLIIETQKERVKLRLFDCKLQVDLLSHVEVDE